MATAQTETADDLDVSVGRRAHHLMWDRKISQASLAPALGMTQTALSRKLRGERKWTLADLVSAARELRVTTSYLLGELPDLDSNQEPAG